MALVTRNPGDTIRSLDVDQLVNLLTGLMADQTVSLPSINVYGDFYAWPVAGPTISSAPLSGGAGASQWWFAVVPVLNGVDGPPGPVFQAPTLGPATLTGTNYFTVNFPNAPGATGYKLIGAIGATQPALSSFQQAGSLLLAVNGQTSYAMLANSALSAYTAQTVPLGGFPTLGYAQITADSAAFSAQTDISGLSVTVTVGAGRRVRITASCGYLDGSVAGDTFNWEIWEGATRLNGKLNLQVPSTGHIGSPSAIAIVTPSAGAHTYKVSAIRAAGTGTGTVKAAATYPAFIHVEDIGT